MNKNTVLVLGATGGIGGEVARQLRDAGWQVRGLSRSAGQTVTHRDGIDWYRGDAMKRDDVANAAKDCAVIVHAVNPPGYRNWPTLVLPMLDNTIAVAVAQQATIVLPGTVYNYGPDSFPILTETSPQNPATKKGKIRAEMERRLSDASRRGANVVIVRAGDFFGPIAGNNWFSQGMIKPEQSVRTVYSPSEPGIGHQWAYLPDVARTIVKLLERRTELDRFSNFHMAGHWDANGSQMTEAICRVVARRTGIKTKTKRLPWWLLKVAAPFVTTLREMQEMRYLWRTSIRMTNERLTAILGQEPHTPLEEAIEASLTGLGCLKGRMLSSSSLER
jgi:nucleoside-diphosphate-sugar epimerase